ncbi:MAG TPA: serine hydrolase domain-containing protein, partial [Candidatus Dormibacteraeota bacterium]|nr:serine hydrolase domain-containing protein [Candidatus Dormibacteraeota bacterium]
ILAEIGLLQEPICLPPFWRPRAAGNAGRAPQICIPCRGIPILSGMPGKFPPLLMLLLLVVPMPIATEAPPLDKGQHIDQGVLHYQKLGYFNGAILVADRNKVIYARGIGEANMESHTPNTPKTRFAIASITKQFTSLLILQQVAEGKIALQGKVTDYLPWYRKDTGSRMTIEQLLHHTSGLPSDFDSPEFNATQKPPASTNIRNLLKNSASPR